MSVEVFLFCFFFEGGEGEVGGCCGRGFFCVFFNICSSSGTFLIEITQKRCEKLLFRKATAKKLQVNERRELT